jgi:RhtB (resistance to homoserine/threonine) family protein
MSDHPLVHVLPFLAVSAIVVVTPGVDMALVTKNALLHGRSAAQATAVGINLGILVWTVAAVLGLAALIATSAAAFTLIKLAGAVYLIYLGVQALRGSRAEAPPPDARATPGRGSAFRQGLASNLLNPNIAVFFTSLLPQFVDADRAGPRELLLLGALFNLMGLVWLLTYAAVAARGRDIFRRPRIRRAVDRVTGVTLVALGVRLALERRH